ncbi:MAG: DUF4373 domain-containing protein [Patescibacteria group bacterium]
MSEAGYFRHDMNARNDPKIRALIKKYKMEGYGRFWVIIEMMRETTGYKIKEKRYIYEALAEQMQCSAEELKKFIKDCIEEFELFTQEDGFFYSESLIQRMTVLENIRLSRQRGAYSMHEKAGHTITKDPYKPQD